MFIVITQPDNDKDEDVLILNVKNYNSNFYDVLDRAESKYYQCKYDDIGDSITDILTKYGYEFDIITRDFKHYRV